MNTPIYLDYAATTPLSAETIKTMTACLALDTAFANPASEHQLGLAANEIVTRARQQLADTFNAEAKEIIFTGSATEANNLALIGTAQHYQSRGKHIISCQTEHKAVLDPLNHLKQQGFNVTLLPVKQNGLIDLKQLEQAIQTDTILISIMHVNNETGVIQDIAAIADIAKRHHIKFHVDAAQSVGKIAIDLKTIAIDLLSINAHKCYGPKGIGALFLRQKTRLTPRLYGGGHERGLRPGTLATHQIAAMGQALTTAPINQTGELDTLKQRANKLSQGILQLPNSYLNGEGAPRYPGIINISFEGVEGEALLMALQIDCAVSSGSACTTTSIEPSHVLLAMGHAPELAHSSIRFSIGRYTTDAEIDFAIQRTHYHVNRLRMMSPE